MVNVLPEVLPRQQLRFTEDQCQKKEKREKKKKRREKKDWVMFPFVDEFERICHEKFTDSVNESVCEI